MRGAILNNMGQFGIAIGFTVCWVMSQFGTPVNLGGVAATWFVCAFWVARDLWRARR